LVNMSSATNVKRRTSRAPVLSTERTALRGRRTAIIDSMLRYLLRKKVATGSLNDLAKAAGMSVSHLLYYFPNKEAVQQQLVATIIEQMNNEMNAYRFAPPEKRIQLLADYFFGGRSIPPAYRSMVLEQMALTMHSTKYRARSKKTASGMQAYLRDLFRGAPMAPSMDVEEAAIIAGSLWMGLFITSYYYDPLTRTRARKIFERVLLQLAGLEGTQAASDTESLQDRESADSVPPVRRRAT
jgi:AcrR family transcriptional regulator